MTGLLEYLATELAAELRATTGYEASASGLFVQVYRPDHEIRYISVDRDRWVLWGVMMDLEIEFNNPDYLAIMVDNLRRK